MKTFFSRYLLLAIASIITLSASAKDIRLFIKTEPEECSVYLNGKMLPENAPCVITVPDKILKKDCSFMFKKEGYETKVVNVKFTKKELEYNPVVHAKLVKKSSPTVVVQQQQAAPKKVDRSHAGKTEMEKAIIRWFFDSDPRGARIYYRVISSCPDEVKNTNEAYLTTTPYEETRGFNIQGLTYDNANNVTVEIKVAKKGYEDQVKRFNVRQALDQQEISGFFELVEKETRE